MGITSSFFTATSGINATSRALSEIGNNIANAQTAGFKSRSVSFGDIFGSSFAGGGTTTTTLVEGRGVRVLGIDASFSQGSIQTTQNALDLAIDGNGFFEVQDSNSSSFYTRAGQFNIDSSGNIVNPAGLKLQGFQADINGTLLGTTGDLVLSTTQQVGQATATVTLGGNLNATETATTFSLADPVGTSHFSTGSQVFDSLGVGHDVTVYFTKTAANAWQYNVVGSTSEATSTSTSGTNALVAQGTLGFTTGGLLDTESAVTYFNAGSTGIDFTGAATGQTIAFDFGTSVTTDSGSGSDGMLQSGGNSVILTLAQDGFANGTLSGTTIGEDGIIQGRFSNGVTRVLGQVLLSSFVNPDGLAPVGRNLFIESVDSGNSLSGAPNSGGLGKVFASSLEASNVDLGEELVNMITMQRGFQANARIINTTDTLLGELVNLAR